MSSPALIAAALLSFGQPSTWPWPFPSLTARPSKWICDGARHGGATLRYRRCHRLQQQCDRDAGKTDCIISPPDDMRCRPVPWPFRYRVSLAMCETFAYFCRDFAMRVDIGR